MGKLLIAVADPPAGLAVTVNGAPLPPDKLGVAVPTATGEAVVRLVAPGKAPVERRVTLRGGEPTTLTVALETASGDASAAPAPVAATRGGGGRVAGFVALGVGVAGMATFAGAGVAANNRYDSITRRAAASTAPTRASRRRSRAASSSTSWPTWASAPASPGSRPARCWWPSAARAL